MTIRLVGIELIPALQLEPAVFEKRERPRPDGNWHTSAEAWRRFWSESLADSGVVGHRGRRDAGRKTAGSSRNRDSVCGRCGDEPDAETAGTSYIFL